MRALKLLHVVPTYLPARRYGGPIYSVHALCRALAAHGNSVDVFTTSADGHSDSDVPLDRRVELDGVGVHYFRTARLRRLYYAPALARKLEQSTRSYDLIHLHSTFLWPTLVAARTASRQAVPYVLSPRGMLVPELVAMKSSLLKQTWIRLFERRTVNEASAMHFTSEIEREDAMRMNLGGRRSFVIPNGVDLVKAESESDRVTQSGPYILFVGRLNWKKGIDRLIRMLTALPEEIRLILAGNDEESYREQIDMIASETGVTHRLIFTGSVHPAARDALMRSALLLVLPSRSENFGNVVLEAMAAGCPVALTSAVGAVEIVREYEAGLVIDENPSVAGPAIANLLADRERLQQFREHGLRAAANFSWSAVASQMEAEYRKIIGSHPHS